MRRNLIIAALLTATTCMAQQKVLFDFDWQFSLNGGEWQDVNLPHDWSIAGVPDRENPSGNDGGYYPDGKGTYRKTFRLPETGRNTTTGEESWNLHFEGSYMDTHVFLNGQEVGSHRYGYTPFTIDITPFVRHDADNELVVTVDNSHQKNCRWYSGSGLYRHVWLTNGTPQPTAAGTDLPSRHYALPTEADGTVPTFFGACVHHDNGILGAAAFDRAEVRRVELLKAAGFNAVRTSHNPASEAFLDACDSLGLYVIDEVFDGWKAAKNPYDYSMWIDEDWEADITAWVERDWHHPCVVAWSIGNEIMERKSPEAVQMARRFGDLVRSLDPLQRPVTQALAAWDPDWEIYDSLAAQHEVVGYNYLIDKAPYDHERLPERIIWQTESYPRDAFHNWEMVHDHPYIVGDFVWTGIDYLGESGIGRWYYEGEHPGEHYQGLQYPWHGAYCGDIDITGWRKPISHYRQLLFAPETAEHQIYMAVREPDGYQGRIHETSWSVWPTWESWNWPGWEGRDIDVEIYSRCDSVALYLNDSLVGRSATTRAERFMARFTLPYAEGTLRAEGIDDSGRTVETVTLATAGEPYALRLTPDRTRLSADGQDLCFVTIEVVDRQGRLCPNAEIPFCVKVRGKSTLQALGNANLQDSDSYADATHTTWKGRALAVLRTTRKGGRARMVTISPLKDEKVRVKCKK